MARLYTPVSLAFFVSVLLLATACTQNTHSENNGPLGTDFEKDTLELAESQPLGTVITPAPKERFVTVLLDLWINQIPDEIEVVTQTPDGVFTSLLGEKLLRRGRIQTFSIQSGNPIPGDLVFFRKLKGDE